MRGCRTDSLYDDCSAWASLYVNRDFVDQYLAHVPVPGSLWLLLSGLAGLFARGADARRDRAARTGAVARITGRTPLMPAERLPAIGAH